MAVSGDNRGGWITFPFIMATLAGLTIATWGWTLNLMVYLIQEFNVKSVTAAKITNIALGVLSMFPIVAAILADSFFGTFSVVLVFSFISFLGVLLFTLTATFESLRPQHCITTGSNPCISPSNLQYTVLYSAIGLAAIGTGGSRFLLATVGANQFDKSKEQGIYFNWYFFNLYASAVISATAIVYVEDSVSWKTGFGICLVVNLIGLVIFLAGKRLYRHDEPGGSPFTGLVQVITAAFRKRKQRISVDREDYYDGETVQVENPLPTKSLSFLNRAAMKTEGDIKLNGSIAKPWRQCTVQQVEDLKTLIRIFPIWTSSLFLNVPIAIQSNLVILQALLMDRHLGPRFKIPAGSMQVIVLITSSLSITLIDRFLLPTFEKLTSWKTTPLQKIGIGHVFNIVSMVVSALVELKRLKTANESDGIQPMLALWLFPQLIIVGIGEAFHFPGNVAFCYQEFPVSLRSTSTSITSLVIGISFYLSTGFVDLVQNVTRWLPDDIDNGRVDLFYWALAVAGCLNFGFFLLCASFYKYRNGDYGKTSVQILVYNGPVYVIPIILVYTASVYGIQYSIYTYSSSQIVFLVHDAIF